MQVIVRTQHTVESYVEHKGHESLLPPERCGCCGRFGALRAHGWYSRWTTNAKGGDVFFNVARFLCAGCRKTTSCLPSFAQTYRLVANATVQAFVEGVRDRLDVQRHEGVLKRYLKRFEGWCSTLRGIVGNGFGRGPPKENATAFLRRAVAACGSLADLAVRLALDFKTTCFGTYRCHQPACAL
jgi:hypothetical protein